MRSGPALEVVEMVVIRDHGCCVVCGEELQGERGWSWSIHHRRGRDGRPDSHMPQNLLSVCGADNVTGCHGRIHRHGKAEAQDNGWWLSRVAGTDPLRVAVLVDRGSRWVYLTADGRYSANPPEVA